MASPPSPADPPPGPTGSRLSRVLLLVLVPVLLGGLVAWLHSGRIGRPESVPALGVAEFGAAPSEAGLAGEEDDSFRRVTLPHDWADEDTLVREGTYRLDVDLGPDPGDGVGLYLPGVNTRATIRVNGFVVGSPDETPGLASRHWHVPLYRSVPGVLLVPGANRIEIRLHVDSPGTGFLSPVFVGPGPELRAAFDVRNLLQVTAIQVLVIALWSLGAFLALLTLLRPKDTSYFWFAVVLFVFGFGFWNLLLIETWLPKPPYRWVGSVTMAWMVLAIVIFANRFLDQPRPRLEAGLAAGVAAGSLWFWLVLGTRAHAVTIPFWGAAVLLVSIYPAVRGVARYRAEPTAELAMALSAGIVLFGAGVHDVALVNGLLADRHDFAIQHAVWASMAIFSFLFVRRFIVALDTSEALTKELTERVEEKAAELEAGYRRMRVLERDQAVARERERILAEIHDGMGGQLVSALAMLRHGEGEVDDTAAAIQSALDDMRLVIHSLDEVEGDVGTLLGSLRARIGRRLEASGLELEWRVADTPPPADFGPEAALQLLRIAQEAITNVLKHSGARTLRVETGVEGEGDERRVWIEIRDDGKGLDPASNASEGRGMRNMHERAARIGATLAVEAAEPGTRVRVSLPAPDGLPPAQSMRGD